MNSYKCVHVKASYFKLRFELMRSSYTAWCHQLFSYSRMTIIIRLPSVKSTSTAVNSHADYSISLKLSKFYHQKFRVTLYAWHIYPETMQQRMFSALFCEVFMWKLFRQFLLTTLIARHYCRFNHLKSEHENLRRLVTNATMIYNVSFSLPRSVWTLKYREITCSRYKCSTGFIFIIVANFSKHSAH
jgi:hypothetical protein